MTFKNLSNLHQRLIISAVAIVTILLAIYLSPVPYFRPFFILIVAAIITGALWEFYKMSKNRGFEPLDTIGIICSVAYVISVFFATQSIHLAILPEIILGISLAIILGYYFYTGKNPLSNIALTVLGIAYLVIPLSYMIRINYFFPSEGLQDGRWWLFYLILVSKMTDTGGYFFGKNFGSKKITPYISPGKTWEGAIGGLIAAIGSSIFVYYAMQLFFDNPPMQLTIIQSVLLGLFVGILAQFGDLAESMLKRDAGIKDSNHLPGLGGVLDIVDSLVFTAPLVYFFLKMQ